MQTQKTQEISGIDILQRLESDQGLRNNFISLIERAVNFIDESKKPDYLRLPVYKSQPLSSEKVERAKTREKRREKTEDKKRSKTREHEKEANPETKRAKSKGRKRPKSKAKTRSKSSDKAKNENDEKKDKKEDDGKTENKDKIENKEKEGNKEKTESNDKKETKEKNEKKEKKERKESKEKLEKIQKKERKKSKEKLEKKEKKEKKERKESKKRINKNQNKEQNQKFHSVDPRLISQLTGHHDWIWKAILSRNGTKIYSCSSDNSIVAWNRQNQNFIKENFGFHDGPVYDLILNKNEDTLITSGKDKTIRFWSTETKANFKNILIESEGFVLQLSPEERTLFVGTTQGALKAIDMLTGQISDFAQAHTNVVRRLIATDKWLISCSQDKLVKIWDVNTLELFATLSGHSKEVFALALSNDGNTLFSGGNENLIYVWNIALNSLQKTIKAEREVGDLILSGSQHELYAGLSDGTVTLIDLSGGRTHHLRAHIDKITSLHLSEDETTLVSASRDKTICVWNTNTVSTLARYFNFFIDNSSLGSFMLDQKTQVAHKISFRSAAEKPSGYVLRLFDSTDYEIFKLRFAVQEKTEEALPANFQAAKLVKVRLEYAEEWKIPLNQILLNKDVFGGMKYTNRIDNFDQSEYLCWSRLKQKNTIALEQFQEILSELPGEVDNVNQLLNAFDLENNFSGQLIDLLRALFQERRLKEPQNEELKLKTENIYNRLVELENAYQQVATVNQNLKSLYGNSSFSFRDYASAFENLISDQKISEANKNYIESISDKNFLTDIKFLAGNVRNGKIEGFSCKAEDHKQILKGQFKQGNLNGIGSVLTSEHVITGRFKDSQLEPKPFYQIEKNGLIRIGDRQGIIRTIIKNKIAFQAEEISEDYTGPAHISFKSESRFTGVIDKLNLIDDVVNEHIVLYFGDEGKSYITRLDKGSQSLVCEKAKFRINWEQGTLTKSEI